MARSSRSAQSVKTPIAAPINPIGIQGAALFNDPTGIPAFTFIFTIFNPRTEDEKTVWVECESDRFVDVLDAYHQVRRNNKLFGYEIFEVLEVARYAQLDPVSA
jgi:hypothetical protein